MLTQVQHNQTSGRRGNDYGKCICLSVPYHELDLIDDMDRLSHLELCSSRSQYIRKLIRRERNKLKSQENSWSTMFGEK